jgi:hypothetical protein
VEYNAAEGDVLFNGENPFEASDLLSVNTPPGSNHAGPLSYKMQMGILQKGDHPEQTVGLIHKDKINSNHFSYAGSY